MSAIVLGADSPIGLTVIRELGRHGVVIHAIGENERAIGCASRFATKHSGRGPGLFADWLPALIARTGARALFAIAESDLVALAALPDRIGGCAILTPRAGPLANVLDKSATLALAARLGIDIPSGWMPLAGEDFAVRAATLAYPVVLKWANPSAVADRLAAHGLKFAKAEFARDAPSLLAALARYDALGTWPLIQSYCPGYGLGQMIYMADGAPVLRFQHRRVHEWPPEGGVSTLCEGMPLDRHGALMEQSVALLAALGWEGPAMVEYRHDPATGRSVLMEVNGRFWGSLPLASASGAEFAWEGWRRRVLGQTSPAAPPRAGLRARYMIPETRRLARLLFTRRTIADPAFRARPARALFDYLADFLRPATRYYVFSASDPGPFLRDMANIVMKLWSRPG